MNGQAVVLALATLVVLSCEPAAAQSGPERFQLGIQVASATSGQFDATDVGFGGRISWHPAEGLGIESEVNLYPSNFPDEGSFSRGRVEGLFGVTVGPRFDRVRPFARLRSGVLSIREAPRPYACILIFPPPLSCSLAAGRTLPAFDLGGGLEVFALRSAFLRVDAGARLLKYPGPVIDNDRAVREDSFFSHDLRFAVGAGVRF